MKKYLLTFLAGVVAVVSADALTLGRQRKKRMKQMQENYKKFYEFYWVLIQWLRIHQEGRTLADFFIKNKYKTVAIYGMKELGEALLEELNETEIEVKYGIDRDADNLYVATDVYRPDEKMESVDVVIVTAIHYFDSIENDLRKKFECPIISIEDVVWEA